MPGYPGQTFKAPLERIAHALRMRNRAPCRSNWKLQNHNDGLSPRQLRDRTLAFRNASYPTLFVPATVVTNDQQHQFVIGLREYKADWVTVQTGQTLNGDIEVLGHWSQEDEVVKTATDAIHTGDSVQRSEITN